MKIHFIGWSPTVHTHHINISTSELHGDQGRARDEAGPGGGEDVLLGEDVVAGAAVRGGEEGALQEDHAVPHGPSWGSVDLLILTKFLQ